MIFNWTISALDCAVKDGALNNVVQTIHWRYSATDADGNTAETYGAQSIAQPDPNNFINFEELTKTELESWLEGAMDVDAMQESLESQIELIKNPVKVTLNPPYNEE
jgi:hypothetical protein